MITSTLQTVHSDNLGADLIVVACGWDRETEALHGLDALLARTVPVDRYTATADGRSYIAEWHRGAESGDAVYVERVEHGAVVFHGWIDPISRRIVQAG